MASLAFYAHVTMTPRAATATIAVNRRARRDYEVLETLECGIALTGSEVKSLREGSVQFADANGWIRGKELWLVGMHIAPYGHAQAHSGHVADRDRKLLAHREEISRLDARVSQERLALVPLSLYFRDGRAKVQLALARGRRTYDKRELLARRTAEREAQRAIEHDVRRR